MTGFFIVIIASLGMFFVLNLALVARGYKMRKREKQLLSNGVTASGSGLCHGMTIDRSKANKVKHDSKKSQAWYSRLA